MLSRPPPERTKMGTPPMRDIVVMPVRLVEFRKVRPFKLSAELAARSTYK